MDITSVSQMYQSKLQEINSRLPNKIDIEGKFNSYLENAKLKTNQEQNIAVDTTELSENKDIDDTNKLLTSLLNYQSGFNSTTSLLSGNNSSENSAFPSMNSSLQVLQQAALLKSLKSKNE